MGGGRGRGTGAAPVRPEEEGVTKVDTVGVPQTVDSEEAPGSDRCPTWDTK